MNHISKTNSSISWTPVSERLPIKSGFYIVTERRGNNIVVAYTYFYDSGQWMGISDEVIAWQPLPEPYKSNYN